MGILVLLENLLQRRLRGRLKRKESTRLTRKSRSSKTKRTDTGCQKELRKILREEERKRSSVKKKTPKRAHIPGAAL